MTGWIILLAWVISNWDVLFAPTQAVEPPKPVQPDCSGLLSQREFGQIGSRHVMQNGDYAAGEMVGRSFMPLLYFNTREDARACAQGLTIARWQNGNWHPE